MNSNVVVIGRVARGLETKEVAVEKNGEQKTTKFGSVTVAVNTGKKNGEGKEILTYYEIETWNASQQKFMRDHLKKGELVAVTGNLSVETYDAENGKRTKLAIKSPSIQLMGNNSSNAGLANVTATGRLTKNVETKLVGDKTLVSFTVAANNPLNDEANFFNIECWDNNKEIGQYIQKGSHVSVSGPITFETYTYKDASGAEKVGSTVKIQNPQINFLEKKRDEAADATQKATAPVAGKAKDDGNLNF